ncbi:T9SS type B sorting domain-containing protein [Chitinophaga agri]|uniref:T9SS type B sorting domain-containing protein n=1 Tax=Chitinophaga agri TaxID=2703787 RepID=A0A6B9Z7P9_9BACT|nr:gliding motility-associated C-terminal domain-containing protein [Chitinophaga agri]QHS58250.1 T9SS type B sorting domain-containing protein [Chitinophaga agri]
MNTLLSAVNRRMSCYRRYYLCLCKPILAFILCLCYDESSGQDIRIQNPSLEGIIKESAVPEHWLLVSRTPDIQPGIYGQTLPASDQQTYVGMICDSRTQEGIAQELVQTLDSGKTYEITFDLATSAYYGKKIAYGSLVVHGSNRKGEREDTLWTSGIITHKTWQSYTAQITPKKRYRYISFSPYKMPEDTSATAVSVLIDHLSDLRESIKLQTVSKNTCLGLANGWVSVNVKAPDSCTYEWQPGSFKTRSVSGLAAGRYRVSVRTHQGATSYADVDVHTSDILAAVQVAAPTCNGEKDAVISIDAAGGQAPYTFYINEEKVGRQSGVIKNLAEGKYTIVVKESGGCTEKKDVEIKSPETLSIASAKTRNTSCSAVTDGMLTVTPQGGTYPYTYSLSGRADQQDSVFNGLAPGEYQYTITDQHHCQISRSFVIAKEYRDCAVWMPNAFSPNGDGQNDIFRAKVHDAVTDFRMAVYGRWGQLVFESRNPDNGWDGKEKGSVVPAGSYLWVVTYTDSKQQAIQQKGTLVLVR